MAFSTKPLNNFDEEIIKKINLIVKQFRKLSLPLTLFNDNNIRYNRRKFSNNNPINQITNVIKLCFGFNNKCILINIIEGVYANIISV